MSAYEKLASVLAAREGDVWKAGFAELEGLIGRKLPASAWKYPAWWSNDPSNNSMTKVWLRAGWRTEQVDVPGRTVVFRRVRSAKTVEESGIGDRSRAFEYAPLETKMARAPEIKMARSPEGEAPGHAETTANVRAGVAPDSRRGAGTPMAQGEDPFMPMEEFIANLPKDHPLAGLFGFLQGTITLAPGVDPSMPACTTEEWNEAEAELEAEWDELYGPDSEYAKNAETGAKAS